MLLGQFNAAGRLDSVLNLALAAYQKRQAWYAAPSRPFDSLLIFITLI